MPPNRIVALFTPVIALAAGSAAAWLSDTIPGLDVSPAQMEAAFVAGLAVVLAPAAQWLYGAQRYEKQQSEIEQQALEADREAAAMVSEAELNATVDDVDDDDYDAYDEYEEYEGDYDDEDGAWDEAGDEDDYAAARDEQPAPTG
jgi:hypothetical protein